MRRALRIIIPFAIVLAIGFTAGVIAVEGQNVIKGAAIALLVDRSAGSLNNTINSLTSNRHLPIGTATKVVPVLSVGTGTYVGGAQVSGPKTDVDKVKAVGQFETNVGRQFRIRALVPVNARSLTNLRRVPGVGVSANIDVRI